MKVKSESQVAQLCPTLATPWTAAYQAPPSMGFSRHKYWSGVPSPSLNDSLGIVIASTYKELPMDQAPMQVSHSHGGISSFQLELLLPLTVQSLSRVQLFKIPWTEALQASLSFPNSQTWLKRMSIKSVMPSNHLILCPPSPPAFSRSQHQGVFK